MYVDVGLEQSRTEEAATFRIRHFKRESNLSERVKVQEAKKRTEICRKEKGGIQNGTLGNLAT